MKLMSTEISLITRVTEIGTGTKSEITKTSKRIDIEVKKRRNIRKVEGSIHRTAQKAVRKGLSFLRISQESK